MTDQYETEEIPEEKREDKGEESSISRKEAQKTQILNEEVNETRRHQEPPSRSGEVPQDGPAY